MNYGGLALRYTEQPGGYDEQIGGYDEQNEDHG
jgi:hypothetical protein